MAGEENWSHLVHTDEEVDVTNSRSVGELAEFLHEQTDLPMQVDFDRVADRFADGARENRMMFLGATAGSGKTAYGPAAQREALKRVGRDAAKIIGIEPRRDATVTAASLSAAVLGVEVGREVGYSTGEGRKMDRKRTKLFFVTPKILERYFMEGKIDKDTCLFVDEAHNRSAEYDMVFGFLKMMQKKGEAPFTVVTSANLNPQLRHFFEISDEDNIKVEGRRYPIETTFRHPENPVETDADQSKGEYLRKIRDKIEDICYGDQEGDILVFLPGKGEINNVMDNLHGMDNYAEVLPLYSGLKRDIRQKVVFDKGRIGKRRVILSTNIAESSYTLPRVRFIIDSCRKRTSYYNPETHTNNLKTEFISHDEAEQRAARAGRVSSGQYFPAVTEETYKRFKKHPQAEIHRVNLSHYILKLKNIGINFEDFPLPEHPVQSAIDAGRRELQALGAMDEHGELTELGKEMAQTSFEPRIARMVIEGKRRGKLLPALVMAAFSREQEVFYEGEKSGYSWGDKNPFGNDSDWLRDIQVMREACVRFKILQSESEENRVPLRAEFYEWCKKENLKPETLKHIAKRLLDFAELVDVEIDDEKLSEALRLLPKNELTPLLLSSYADCLLTKSPQGEKYTRLETGDKSVVIGEGSAAYRNKPQMCLATEITIPKGHQSYGNRVHPVSLAEVRDILKEFITQGKTSNYDYDSYAGVVRADVECYYNIPGGTPVFLSNEQEEVHDEEAARLFIQREIIAERAMDFFQKRRRLDARWGYDEDDEQEKQRMIKNNRICSELLSVDTENQEAFLYIARLYHRSGGAFELPEIFHWDEWYLQKLRKSDGTFVNSLQEVEAILGDLKLNTKDYFSKEELSRVDNEYPQTVTFNGKVYTLQYKYSKEAGHSATIHTDPQELLSLPSEGVPVLGSETRPLLITFRVNITPGKSVVIESTNLDSLKARVESELIRTNIFPAWEKQQEKKPVMIEQFQPLPEVEPVQFYTSYTGKPVSAYKGIATVSGRGSRFDDITFQVGYFLTEQDARASIASVRHYQEVGEMGQVRFFHEVNSARQVYERVRALVDSLQNEKEKYGLPDQNWEPHINRDLRTAQGVLFATEGNMKLGSPSSAVSVLEKIERVIQSRPAEVERKRELLPEIQAAQQAVGILLREMEVLGREKNEWNVTPNEVTQWKRLLQDGSRNVEISPAFVLGTVADIRKRIEKRKEEYIELDTLYQVVRASANTIFVDEAHKYTIEEHERQHLKREFDIATAALYSTEVNLHHARTRLTDLFYIFDSYLHPELHTLTGTARKLLDDKRYNSTTGLREPMGFRLTVTGGRVEESFTEMRGDTVQFICSGEGGNWVGLKDGNILVHYTSENIPLREYVLSDGMYAVDRNAGAVIEFEVVASSMVRAIRGVEAQVMSAEKARQEQRNRIDLKIKEISQSIQIGDRQGFLLRASDFRQRLLSMQTGSLDSVEESLQRFEAEIERYKKRYEDRESALVEVKKLYEILSDRIDRHVNYEILVEHYRGVEALKDRSFRTIEAAIPPKGPYCGISTGRYEELYENWGRISSLCSGSDNYTDAETAKKLIHDIFQVVRECENFQRNGRFYGRDPAVQIEDEVKKIMRDDDYHVLIVKDGQVVRMTKAQNLSGGEQNPRSVRLRRGNILNFNYRNGYIARCDSSGQPLETYHLEDGCYVVNPFGDRVIRMNLYPTDLLEPVEVVEDGAYFEYLEPRFPEPERVTPPPRRELPPRREDPPFGRRFDNMSVGRFGERSRVDTPPRQVFGSEGSVGSGVLADAMRKLKAENPVQSLSDDLSPTSPPAAEVKKQMGANGKEVMTEALRAALIGDLEVIEILLLEIAGVRHDKDKNKIKLIGDGAKIMERLGEITVLVKTSQDGEKARSSVAGTLGEVKRIADKLRVKY